MKWHIQFSRYALVGLFSNFLGYLLYLLLTYYVGMGPKSAMSLLYAVGVVQTFYFNRGWSFGHKGNAQSAFARYVIAYALGYLLQFGLLWFAVDHLQLPHQAIMAVAIFVVAGFLFLMHRYWVFAPPVHEHSG
jgi:putative flippase GtrA